MLLSIRPPNRGFDFLGYHCNKAFVKLIGQHYKVLTLQKLYSSLAAVWMLWGNWYTI